MEGPGCDKSGANSGASYAGQGGNCYHSDIDLTYGTFDMVYNDSESQDLQIGSGGGEWEPAKGGGKVVAVGNKLQIAG